MVSTQVVVLVLVVEAVALMVGLALLAGHGGWWALRERRLAPRVLAARAEIIAQLIDRPGEELPLALLDGLPVSERLRVLGEVEHSVGGAQRAAVGDLARRAGMLERAGRLCRSRRWRSRLRGARIHTLLGGGEEEVPRLFDDRHAAVRAEAATWAAAHPRPDIVARLLELLGDEATLCRFTVKDSLLRLGPAAVDPLARFLASASGERATAGLEVAATLSDPRLLDAAFRLLHAEDAQTRRRATDVLGAIGGERAAAAVAAALDDRAPEVRAAAAQAIGTGQNWSVAPQLAAAMRDSSWDVRRAAGLALRELGAPGELLLRRILLDEDRFAGDMARLMLETPVTSR